MQVPSRSSLRNRSLPDGSRAPGDAHRTIGKRFHMALGAAGDGLQYCSAFPPCTCRHGVVPSHVYSYCTWRALHTQRASVSTAYKEPLITTGRRPPEVKQRDEARLARFMRTRGMPATLEGQPSKQGSSEEKPSLPILVDTYVHVVTYESEGIITQPQLNEQIAVLNEAYKPTFQFRQAAHLVAYERGA